jgi:hypothetical protein
MITRFLKWWRGFFQREEMILDWLRANPGWHLSIDVVNAGLADRTTVYIYLGRLEERGLIESSFEDLKPPRRFPRPVYRAAGAQR